MIGFHVTASSAVPTYMQLVEQVRQALRLGRLEPGDRLPTVREVAAAVAINPNTVLKAYRELEHEGLVEGRPGQGTYVVRSLSGPSPQTLDKLRRASSPGSTRRVPPVWSPSTSGRWSIARSARCSTRRSRHERRGGR